MYMMLKGLVIYEFWWGNHVIILYELWVKLHEIVIEVWDDYSEKLENEWWMF